MDELIYTRTISTSELHRMVLRILGRPAKNIEIGGNVIRIDFDPPATQEERQDITVRLEKLGYFLNEDFEDERD